MSASRCASSALRSASNFSRRDLSWASRGAVCDLYCSRSDRICSSRALIWALSGVSARFAVALSADSLGMASVAEPQYTTAPSTRAAIVILVRIAVLLGQGSFHGSLELGPPPRTLLLRQPRGNSERIIEDA